VKDVEQIWTGLLAFSEKMEALTEELQITRAAYIRKKGW